MYEYLDPAVRNIVIGIDSVEPTSPPNYIRESVLLRIAEIDQNLTDIKLALIAFNNADNSIHEFGVPAREAVDFLAGRRDRLVKFLEEAGLEDRDGDTILMPITQLPE